MPELPEVETVRQGLLPLIGQRVMSCDVRRRDVIRDQCSVRKHDRRGPIEPGSLMIGSTITDIRRHGKQLGLIVINPEGIDHAVGIHLGMSGQVLITSEARITPAKHVHVVWTLESGARIAFRDPRRFGKVVLHPSVESLELNWARLGPDGEHITSRALRDACKRTTRPIKGALLDQRLIAGVGNIYADESLFDAQINPFIPANELDSAQLGALARSIRKILRSAIRARGSTLRDYRDTGNQTGSAQLFHKVYGRAGLECVRCSATLASAQIAQRTTCWCPICQPMPVAR